MKRTKFLSLVLAIAMVFSLVPSIMVSADSDVIWSENFDGKTTANLKSQGYTINDNDSRIVVENGIGVAKTSEGGSGFTFSNLSAKAEGLVRVKYDVKLFNNAFDVNKSLLVTDKGNLPLIFFGAYGAIAQDYSIASWSATLNPVSGVGYGTHWYNVDLLLDFDNGKITVNLKNLDDGTMTIENLVWDYDTLKSVSTIKGFDTYGWTHGNVADTGYDNMSIAYVSSANTPDGPAKEQVIYSQDFNAVTSASSLGTLEGAGVAINNGIVVWPADKSAGGFWFNNLDAKVADAPAGKISVKFDVKTPDTGAGATKFSVKTNGSNVDLVSYGVWNCLRVTQLSEELGNPGFNCDVWHTNDIVLDFVNNKIIYNVYEKDSGKFVLENFARDVDMSSVTAIKGFDAYGWAGAAELDNLVISYVGEEAGTPDTPDEPEFDATIYEQNFNNITLSDLGTLEGSGLAISNGQVVWPASGAAGFHFETLNAEPTGKVRVKFEMISPETVSGATKGVLKAAGGDIPLISYGVHGCLRQTQQGNEFMRNGGLPSYTPNAWHVNDIVIDFDANKMIYNVYELENGAYKMENFEIDYDLSKVTAIKGLDFYGWAGPAKLDNLTIEYVGNDTPDTPDEPDFEALIYTQDFDNLTSASALGNLEGVGVSLNNGAVMWDANKQAGGFWFKTLDAKVADAPLGQIRFKFDVRTPDTGAGATKFSVTTNSSNVNLISYGVWNCLRVTEMSEELGSPGFQCDVWHTNDIVLDFVNNKIIYNVYEKDSGAYVLKNFERSVDMSSVTAIKGFDAFGWAGAAELDNLVIEYVTETTPDEPDEPISERVIYSNNYDDGNIASVGTLADAGITIQNGEVVWPADKSAGGFRLGNLNAEAKGQILVQFDVKSPDPGPAATKFAITTNASNVDLISYGVWGVLRVTQLGEGELGDPGFTADAWYRNSIVFDFATNELIYNVYNKDTGTYAIKDYVRNVDLSSITKITGFEGYGWSGAVCFDNLSIEYYSEDPVLNGDSVKIYSGDVEEKHTSVNPGADKIVIDFAGVMDEATLENAVSIKNLTDDTDVAFSAELISTKYIITIDGGLAASKNYRLTVTADAANIFGVALEGDYTLDFVTNAGYVKVSDMKLTQNGVEVTSLADLAQGQQAKVTFNFEKTCQDSRNVKLIYVYYNGDELVKSVVKTVTISQEDKNGTKEDTEVIENLSGITSVSVMLWENFTSIKPLCEDIKLQ